MNVRREAPMRPLLLMLALSLAGCPKPDAAKPASAMGGDVAAAATAANSAATSADNAEADRLARLRANVDGCR